MLAIEEPLNPWKSWRQWVARQRSENERVLHESVERMITEGLEDGKRVKDIVPELICRIREWR